MKRNADWWRQAWALAAFLGGLSAPPALAQNWDAFLERSTLVADPAGVRKRLEARGVTVNLQHIGEIWTTPRGGLRQGTVFGSVLQGSVEVDTAAAGLWTGGKLYVSALHIGGRFPGQDLVGNLQPATNIEARRGVLLYEAWAEQELPRQAGSLRLGQLRADAEFLTSTYTDDETYANAGALFLNASFGFPVLAAASLPSGGPAYPLATPGARLKLAPTDQLTLLLGAFNGTPQPSAFTFRGGLLLMAEAQYAINQAVDDPGLPGTWRIGAWHHTDRFDDLRRDAAARSLADPLSTGVARRLRGQSGIYLMADQLLWQTGTLRAEALGAFARVIVGQGDRSTVDLQLNGGITWKGLVPGRPDDSLGLGVSWARIGGGASGLDRDLRSFGMLQPVRSSETVMEATYQIALAGWWQVQPSVQHVNRPGGGTPDPRRPGRTLRDAWVAGVRSTIVF